MVPEPSVCSSSRRAEWRVERTRREGTVTHRVVNNRSSRVGGLHGMSCRVLDATGGVQGLLWMLVGPHFLAWRVDVGSQGCASQLEGGSAVMAVPAMGLSSVASSPVSSASSMGGRGHWGCSLSSFSPLP